MNAEDAKTRLCPFAHDGVVDNWSGDREGERKCVARACVQWQGDDAVGQCGLMLDDCYIAIEPIE